MAQKILSDSGLLIEAGKTTSEFESAGDWDPINCQVVNTGQTFDSDDRSKWFYFPTLNTFYQATSKKHAVFAAAETLFTAERWTEIEDILDERGSVRESLARLDLTRARRKIQRARTLGLITVAEVQALAQLVAHL